MGTTSKGYPYPNPTDPLANTDLAIKALADFLNTNNLKALHASTAVVAVAAAQSGFVDVVYPAGKFSAAPLVFLTAEANGNYVLTESARTAAGFRITAQHRAGTAATVNLTVLWVAIQLA